jgi:hypothetical protein
VRLLNTLLRGNIELLTITHTARKYTINSFLTSRASLGGVTICARRRSVRVSKCACERKAVNYWTQEKRKQYKKHSVLYVLLFLQLPSVEAYMLQTLHLTFFSFSVRNRIHLVVLTYRIGSYSIQAGDRIHTPNKQKNFPKSKNFRIQY